MPDGAYTFEHDKPHFHRAPAPSPTELRQLLDTLIARITRTLVRGGVLIEEPEHPYVDKGAQVATGTTQCRCGALPYRRGTPGRAQDHYPSQPRRGGR